EHRIRKLALRFMLFCAILGILGAGTYLIYQAQATPEESPQGQSLLLDNVERRVSFVAVGDNLPDEVLGAYADACAGVLGDGLYDYRPIYSAIKPYIESADLAYLNFETHAGGDDIGPRGYPSYNTTDAMVDAIFDTGFNLIASATNHSYDWGLNALKHSAELWKAKPVLFTGTATSPADAFTIATYEKNGIVFSLLNYTYGINGYREEDIPGYAVNYLHEDRIRADIAQARALSDVVIVALHWGTENQAGPDSEQQYYAQLIANAGADLILGSHPHVIGPLVWLEGLSGKKTLVAYSLGNFISRHEYPDYFNELEGMLKCDFVKDGSGVRIENVSWVPLVNHTEEGNYRVYALRDYTPQLAANHATFYYLEDPIAWLKEKTLEIIGSEFHLDY
ncbi:MAG: CapA family protein, partial [Eggerthellaceae bacterium]|nr:CapA family protein [Eggerthellaceae bacterium]